GRKCKDRMLKKWTNYRTKISRVAVQPEQVKIHFQDERPESPKEKLNQNYVIQERDHGADVFDDFESHTHNHKFLSLEDAAENRLRAAGFEPDVKVRVLARGAAHATKGIPEDLVRAVDTAFEVKVKKKVKPSAQYLATPQTMAASVHSLSPPPRRRPLPYDPREEALQKGILESKKETKRRSPLRRLEVEEEAALKDHQELLARAASQSVSRSRGKDGDKK
ncbi:unnamed protein product, partial [Polarella glacialis]